MSRSPARDRSRLLSQVLTTLGRADLETPARSIPRSSLPVPNLGTPSRSHPPDLESGEFQYSEGSLLPGGSLPPVPDIRYRDPLNGDRKLPAGTPQPMAAVPAPRDPPVPHPLERPGSRSRDPPNTVTRSSLQASPVLDLRPMEVPTTATPRGRWNPVAWPSGPHLALRLRPSTPTPKIGGPGTESLISPRKEAPKKGPPRRR